MAPTRPVFHTEPEALARAIIDRVGKSIVLAIPLGIGKPNHIVNALFAQAAADSSIHLSIFTALTLERPVPSSELEKRFLEPAMQRLFGDYPPLAYTEALRNGTMPDNIEVDEFFILAGRWRNVARVQQNYISANYSQVLQLVLDRGVNVVGQLVAKSDDEPGARYSLSCNPDITAGLIQARKAGDADFILAGQVNSELPFMESDAAIVPEETFDFVLESADTDFELFSVPKRPVSVAEYAIGIHTARLVVDGGTLQIGIGSVGDAVAHALVLRHQKNDEFRRLLHVLEVTDDVRLPCEDKPFETGLYGASEMLVDGFLQLEAAGVLKRAVDGVLVHAGFFLESRDFYKTLREMPAHRRRRFAMMPISFTNTLHGGTYDIHRDRRHARFINNAMMATLLGAVISDGTEDGQVISGVGGQFDFVQQGLALDGARSIITLDAVRISGGKTVSNILWSYGHTTIPRHMRDIVVTEYGVADLRGKSDAHVIAAMLSITDSRFQPELLRQAKQSGKIREDYEIPKKYRDNSPDRIRADLEPARSSGLLPVFPFGSDFTADEQRLIPALEYLKYAAGSKLDLLKIVLRGATAGHPSEAHDSALVRMGLGTPKRPKEWLYRWLVHAALLANE